MALERLFYWPFVPALGLSVQPQLCLRRQSQPLSKVLPFAQRPPPSFIVTVPPDSTFDSIQEILPRTPTKLPFKFGRINGVAPIVAWPINYELDEPIMGACLGHQPVKDRADRFHDRYIRLFIPSTNVISLANPPLTQDQV
jgi:hypothetical protein